MVWWSLFMDGIDKQVAARPSEEQLRAMVAEKFSNLAGYPVVLYHPHTKAKCNTGEPT